MCPAVRCRRSAYIVFPESHSSDRGINGALVPTGDEEDAKDAEEVSAVKRKGCSSIIMTAHVSLCGEWPVDIDADDWKKLMVPLVITLAR